MWSKLLKWELPCVLMEKKGCLPSHNLNIIGFLHPATQWHSGIWHLIPINNFLLLLTNYNSQLCAFVGFRWPEVELLTCWFWGRHFEHLEIKYQIQYSDNTQYAWIFLKHSRSLDFSFLLTLPPFFFLPRKSIHTYCVNVSLKFFLPLFTLWHI